MSDYLEPKDRQMSEFLTKTIDKKGTALAHGHIVEGKGFGSRGQYNSHDPKPTRKGYPSAGDEGAGFNYTPPSQAGHKV